MSDTPRFVDRVFDLNHQAMGDESDWDEHGKAMMDLAREADELERELAAAQAEIAALRDAIDQLAECATCYCSEGLVCHRCQIIDAARKP